MRDNLRREDAEEDVDVFASEGYFDDDEEETQENIVEKSKEVVIEKPIASTRKPQAIWQSNHNHQINKRVDSPELLNLSAPYFQHERREGEPDKNEQPTQVSRRFRADEEESRAAPVLTVSGKWLHDCYEQIEAGNEVKDPKFFSNRRTAWRRGGRRGGRRRGEKDDGRSSEIVQEEASRKRDFSNNRISVQDDSNNKINRDQ